MGTEESEDDEKSDADFYRDLSLEYESVIGERNLEILRLRDRLRNRTWSQWLGFQ